MSAALSARPSWTTRGSPRADTCAAGVAARASSRLACAPAPWRSRCAGRRPTSLRSSRGSSMSTQRSSADDLRRSSHTRRARRRRRGTMPGRARLTRISPTRSRGTSLPRVVRTVPEGRQRSPRPAPRQLEADPLHIPGPRTRVARVDAPWRKRLRRRAWPPQRASLSPCLNRSHEHSNSRLSTFRP